MTEPTPLYTLNPLTRFSNRAEDYAKYRPTYPTEAIDIILEGFSNVSEIVAADIGAGTGISSRLLAGRGVNVIAIEPNAAMREAAQVDPKVEFREGTAEATNISDKSVDLVSCFQAFHWFNPEPTLLEFHRILKPKGWLAVIWNNRDCTNEVTNEYSRIIIEISENHPAESTRNPIEPLLATSYFTNYHEYNFNNHQQLDLTGLIGRATSYSYVPREGKAYEKLISQLQSLYERFCDQRGFVYLAYQTSVHLVEPLELQ
jgi:ubiquinone/menaquinone biosynthesis C-methylase UbiE